MNKDFLFNYKVREGKGCGTVLVLDGNQKNNRQVCAGGFVEYAGLPRKVKTGCMDTPEQQSKFCPQHKPRQMISELHCAELPSSEGMGGVVEMILNKKVTRTTTFYQVS